MDPQKIKLLLEAVEAGSLSKVAEAHHYTPSALSHIADHLEEELGVVLFRRGNRGISLSENGQKLLPCLKALIRKDAELHHAALAVLAEEKHNLCIGCYSSIAKSVLPALIHELKTHDKNMEISVLVGNSTDELIASGKADVVIAENSSLPGICFRPFCADRYVAVVKEKDFLHKTVLTRQDFAHLPFILPNDMLVRRYFDRLPEQLLCVTSDDNDSAIAMVQQGLGVTILPLLSVRSLPQGLCTRELDDPMERVLGLVYQAEAAKNSSVGFLLRCLSSKFRKK